MCSRTTRRRPSVAAMFVILWYALFCHRYIRVSTEASGVGYQVHSLDDLRSWPQTFAKGATSIKVDAYYVDYKNCVLLHPTPDFEGCLLLTHDSPVVGRRYDSLNDVLLFISRTDMAMVFQKYPVTIAICFKTISKPCDDSITSNRWLSLVTAFHEAAMETVRRNHLLIEFVLDGVATPNLKRLCLRDMFRPWVATWISHRDDPASALSNEGVHGRFRILNEKVSEVDSLSLEQNVERFVKAQADGFHKFAQDSDYPLQVWEPSSEEVILEVARRYVSNDKPMLARGLDFSINIDISRFEVYKAEATSDTWRYRIEPGARRPFVTVLRPTSSKPLSSSERAWTTRILMVWLSENSEIVTQYFQPQPRDAAIKDHMSLPLIGNSNLVALAPPSKLSRNPKHGMLSSVSSASVALSTHLNTRATLLLLTWRNRRYELYRESKSMDLRRVSGGVFDFSSQDDGLDPHSPHHLASTVVDIGSMSRAGMLEVYSLPSCPVHVAITLVSFAKEVTMDPVDLGEEDNCLLPREARDLRVEDASIAALRSKVDSSVIHVVVVYTTRDSDVLSLSFDYDFDLSRVVGLTPHAAVIGVGQMPSVVLRHIPNTSSVAVLSTVGYSYCEYSAVNNLRAFPAFCDQVPVATPYTLGYTYGLLTDWRQHISTCARTTKRKRSEAPQACLVSSCHKSLFHGTFDQGAHPHAALFPATRSSLHPRDNIPNHAQLVDTLAVVEVHEGPRSRSDAASGGCGASLPWKGIVVAQWTLPLLTPVQTTVPLSVVSNTMIVLVLFGLLSVMGVLCRVSLRDSGSSNNASGGVPREKSRE
eukprot:TRINITY_DN1593_c0_g1_i1.p1 TRINITY_DN1593_c0_g1~~TRINITY_DN1593_c0_g1_i1.p1  ORF type:complete len:817 (-),score=91.68 TRINITY_DN1593_c0_g1_i1:942-3392(-)